jgi:glycogen operon protein
VVRDFWRGEPDALSEFANRLSGSSDLYESDGPRSVRLDQLRDGA